MPRLLARLLLLVTLALTLPAGLAQTRKPWAPLKPGNQETLAGCGVKLRLFKDALAIPMEALSSRVETDPATQARVELYPAVDYWRHRQIIGKWQNEGATLVVLEIKHPALEPGVDIFSRDRFTTWAAANPLPPQPDLAAWILMATGLKAAPAPTAAPLKGSGDVLITPCEITGPTDGSKPGRQFLYLASSAQFRRTLLLWYTIELNPVPEKTGEVIATCAAATAFLQAKTVELTRKAGNGDRNRVYTDDYLASKQKAIDNVKNIKGWWYLETDNYLIISNQKNPKLVNVLKKDLERARSGFETVYPLLAPLSAVSVVRLFDTREEYLGYTQVEWSGGLWMPDKNELVVSDPNWGNRKDEAAVMRNVVIHEGFHQYLSYAAGQTHVWFNEGHAQFFEGMSFAGTGFKIELADRDAARLATAIASTRRPLPEFLEMTAPEFYGSGLDPAADAARRANYAFAWGLVHYLNMGCLLTKKTESYAEIPLRYYVTMAQSKDSAAAQMAAFQGVDLKQLEADFRAFWQDKGSVKRSLNVPFLKKRLALLNSLVPGTTPAAPATPAAVAPPRPGRPTAPPLPDRRGEPVTEATGLQSAAPPLK